MTLNDRRLTKALLKITRKHKNAAASMRAGELRLMIDDLQELTNWVDEARRRAKELLNERTFPPSRGGVSG